MWAPEVYNIIPYINVTNETNVTAVSNSSPDINLILTGAGISFVLGLIDDLVSLSQLVRLIVQFILAPIIFREWFTFKVWDDYQRTGDEDENPFVKQGLANVIVSIFVMIAVSVLRSKGYI